MKFPLRLFLLLIFAGAVRAQTGPDTLWTRTYPWVPLSEVYTATSGASDIREDGDGFLITCPVYNGLPEDRIDERYYFKINANGDTLWSQRCSGLDPEAYPRCIESGYGDARKVLSMINKWNGPSSNPVSTPSHPRMQYIVRTSDGGWILGGTSRSSYDQPGVFMCSFVLKLDNSGAELWTRDIGCEKKPPPDSTGKALEMQKPERRERYVKKPAKSATDRPGARQFYIVTEMTGLRATPDGGCLAFGATSTPRSHKDTDTYIVRLSAAGDTLWTWLGGTDRQNRVEDLLLLANGGCLALSHPDLLIRLEPNGQLAWMQSIPALSGLHCCRLLPAKGGFLITGIGDDVKGWNDMQVLKISDSGDLIWRGKYQSPGTSMSMCNAAVEISDGGYLLAGLWNGKVGIVRLASDSIK